MATLGPTIDTTGISAPSYADILAELQNAYWSIYGSDAVLTPDTQDGQFLAILAQAISDANQVAIAIYSAYSPAGAQGAGLASVVKINGLTKQSASNSTADVVLTGVGGTVITGGQIGDNLGLNTVWNLPPSVTIDPITGTVEVTATCNAAGAVAAAAGSLANILTPTLGWQEVTNPDDAVAGAPVESDAALRQRQAASTALPAQAIVEGIYAAVAAIPGVSELKIYENPADTTDDNSLPPHSISVVALGGDAQIIAQTIALKKTPGTATYGAVSEQVIDQNGVPLTINFNQLQIVPLDVTITVKALVGYTSAIGLEIQSAVAAFVNSLDIGEDSYLNRLIAAASLGGVGDGATFVVTGVTQSVKPAAQEAADVDMTYDQQASLALADVTITVS